MERERVDDERGDECSVKMSRSLSREGPVAVVFLRPV